MRVCVIGTGYVGLVSGACLADVGNTVWCIDKNPQKVKNLQNGTIPIFEPGLKEIVTRNEREQRLFFSTELAEGLKAAEFCLITVDTPPDGDGRADLTNVLAVAKQLGQLISEPKIVVTKSTVPVGTTLRVKQVIQEELKKRGLAPELVKVANNPEFLKEGDAVNDAMKPDRVVVGVEEAEVGEKLHELYAPFMRQRDRFICVDVASSELIKYAANAMLATRISFMNELARLAEKVGADINHVRHGIGSDPRIGPGFLYAGLGYGGSCFPKDMKALVQLGHEYGETLTVCESADKANDAQRAWFWQKIVKRFGGEQALKGKKVAIWGVAFKPETDDVRFAASLDLIAWLLSAGAEVAVYDPVAQETGKAALGELAQKVKWCALAYDCLPSADALVICTEWREFRSPDFAKMAELMKQKLIFDGRLLYSRRELQQKGFEYFTIGR